MSFKHSVDVETQEKYLFIIVFIKLVDETLKILQSSREKRENNNKNLKK